MSNCSFSMLCKQQKLVGGAYPCFVLALFSCFTRFLLLSLIKIYWLALPIQLLESTGFVLSWAAAVEFMHKNTSKQIAVTMFNLIFWYVIMWQMQYRTLTVAKFISNMEGEYSSRS